MSMQTIDIRTLILGMYGTNCYIVSKKESEECFIIDPADQPAKILDAFKRLGKVPTAILLTHGHSDHILAVPALQKQYPGIPVYCHSSEVPVEKTTTEFGENLPTIAAFDNIHKLEDLDMIKAAGIELQMLHTPGHTPGSAVYVFEDVMFSGDTLFCRSIGRTDFVGGNMRQMKQSLKRLAGLPGNYRVFPGHDSGTDLDSERRFNPYLQML